MTGKRTRAVAVGLAFIVTCAPLLAHASEADAESEALVLRGVELRTAGRNVEALELFERAYARHATPRTRAQIALASQALGAWIEAERGLDQALEAEGDPWIDRYRSTLEAARLTVRSHLGWLKVATNVTGAELLVNGAPVCVLPSEPLRVVAGTAVIGVRAKGYLAARRRVDISPEAPVREVMIMEPVVEAREGADNVLLPSAHSRDSKSVASAGLAFGGAALLAATGLVAISFHEENASVYNDPGRCLVGTSTRDEQCGEYARRAEMALWVESLSFIAAGALVITGASILATQPSKGVAFGCTPSAMGLRCRGQF